MFHVCCCCDVSIWPLKHQHQSFTQSMTFDLWWPCVMSHVSDMEDVSVLNCLPHISAQNIIITMWHYFHSSQFSSMNSHFCKQTLFLSMILIMTSMRMMFESNENYRRLLGLKESVLMMMMSDENSHDVSFFHSAVFPFCLHHNST